MVLNALTPYNTANSLPLQRQQASIRTPHAQSVPHNTPRFGSSLDSMVQFFTKVNEVFVWEFLFQDVVDLWIPRVAISLVRGRDRVDYNKFSEAERKHPFKTTFKLFKETLKGFNYKNAAEETWREAETGPALFLAPTVVFAYAVSQLPAKKALTLHFKEGLEPHQAYFKNWLAKINPDFIKLHASQGNKVLTAKLAEEYLLKQVHSHFTQASSKAIQFRTFNTVAEADKGLEKFLNTLPGKSKTYQEALHHWAKQWVSAAQTQHQFLNRKHDAHVAHLEDVFKRLVHHYNLDVHHVAQNLNLWEKVMVRDLYKSAAKASTFAHDNRKFFSFIEACVQKTQHHIGPYVSNQGWETAFKNTAQQASDILLKKTTNWKMGLSLLATILTGLLVFKISSIAQKGEKYPGINNMEFTPNTNNNATTSATRDSRAHHAAMANTFTSPSTQQPNIQAAASLFGPPIAGGSV